MELKVKLTDGAPLPRHAKSGDAGMDLTTREAVTLRPGESKMVGTGVSVEIPEGYFGLVAPRSGLASKRGITFRNAPGIIDSQYRGEIKVALENINPVFDWDDPFDAWYDYKPTSKGTEIIERGERVCQLIIVPFATCECVEVDELSDTERGEGGFGSSGRM